MKEFAVFRHFEYVDDLPMNLLMVCHACLLVCVKYNDSTVSVYFSFIFLFTAAVFLCSMFSASLWACMKLSY